MVQAPQAKFNEVEIAPSRWRRLEVVRENIDLKKLVHELAGKLFRLRRR
jgi:hypothetical protein